MAQVGSAVTYVDEHGEEHQALITQRWDGQPADTPIKETAAVNLLYVSGGDAETDQYGRQIKRASSVQGESAVTAPGRFWRE
jgi:hypothetical protein